MIWTLQSLFGQFFDAMVGQMVHALSASRPPGRSSSWGASERGGSHQGGNAPAPAGGSSLERQGIGNQPTSIAVPAWEPAARPAAAAHGTVWRHGEETAQDVDLLDDAVKLVRYVIVSVSRCNERILPDGSGEILVTGSMTADGFAAWMIARYLQGEDGEEAGREARAKQRIRSLPRDEKRYLRVHHRVLESWPRGKCSESRKIKALKGIRDAIRDLSRRPDDRPPAQPLPGPALPPAGPLPPAAPEVGPSGAASPETVPPESPQQAMEPPPPAAPKPETAPPAAERAEPSEEEKVVLQALVDLGGTAATSQLVRRTGLRQSQVRQAIKGLEAAGRIRRTGEGLQTRYQAMKQLPKPPTRRKPR